MTKEEAKQYIRNLIDSSLKTQHKFDNDIIYLCYNKQYLRALKLSTITGKPVNKENFKGGDVIFWFDAKNKEFWYYSKIRNYLYEYYSIDSSVINKTIEEVINDYEEYKGYNYYL